MNSCISVGENVGSGWIVMIFKFSDTASFGDNCATYVRELERLDSIPGPVLAKCLDDLAAGADSSSVLGELCAALVKAPEAP
jgi:hypothetical protein